MTATTPTTGDARAGAIVAGTTTTPRLTTRETGRATVMTVSSLIDELEDAHREPMGAAEKQAWAEVDRLTTLAKALEVERARVALLERELAHIRDQVAASMRAAGVTP